MTGFTVEGGHSVVLRGEAKQSAYPHKPQGVHTQHIVDVAFTLGIRRIF